MTSEVQPKKSTASEIDMANAARGLWLVKVPKYIAERWEKAPGNIEVGKLNVTKQVHHKSEITLNLSEAIMSLKNKGDQEIPKLHKLDVSTVTNQTIGVFTHQNDSNGSATDSKKSMEGRIVQRLECRPVADNTYMKLKLESIKKASIPLRSVKQLQRAVVNYKPVSDHKHNIMYAKEKKAEGKMMKSDKQEVLEMLFSAFEKHQYYYIKDLVRITRQPVVHLKSILGEVCNYNVKNPHKHMWELKPEYRHYEEKRANVNNIQDDSD